jgi:hypothetical protein
MSTVDEKNPIRLRSIILNLDNPTNKDTDELISIETKYTILGFDEPKNFLFGYMEFGEAKRLNKMISKLNPNISWKNKKSSSHEIVKKVKECVSPEHLYERGFLSNQGFRSDLKK